MNNINNPIHDPFEDINPIRKVKQEKRNQGDILINRFREIIENMDKKSLLKINEILINKLKEFE